MSPAQALSTASASKFQPSNIYLCSFISFYQSPSLHVFFLSSMFILGSELDINFE